MIRLSIKRAYQGNNLHIPCSGAYLDLELSEGAPDLFVGSQRLPSAPSADTEPSWKTAAYTSPLELSELLRDSVEEALSYFSADAKRLGTVDVSFSDHGRSVGIRIPHAEPNLALEIAHWAVMRLCSALGHGGDVTPIPPTASAIRELVAALNSSPTLDAIALAARQRHIHVARFDRWPFAPSDGEQAPEAHRGVMVLGQGNRQKRITPQGLMPVAEETRRLLQDRIAFLEALDQAQIPTAKRDTEFKNIGTLSRTLRSAARIGYPVFIKPRFKSLEQADIGCSFKSSDDLITSYERIFGAGRKVVVEAMLAGDTYRILVIAGSAVSVRKLAHQLSNNSSQ